MYVNNIALTGAFRNAFFDDPVAMNLRTGHGYQVWNGDINQENGATLVAKWLWDLESVAFIENYTRPFLGDGDGHIELYETKPTTAIEALRNIWDFLYASIDANGNPAPNLNSSGADGSNAGDDGGNSNNGGGSGSDDVIGGGLLIPTRDAEAMPDNLHLDAILHGVLASNDTSMTKYLAA